jgi:hypothetical protein
LEVPALRLGLYFVGVKTTLPYNVFPVLALPAAANYFEKKKMRGSPPIPALID